YLALPLWSGLEAAAALRALTNLVQPVLQSDSALANLLAPWFARVRSQPGAFSRVFRWSARFFFVEGFAYWIVLVIFREPLVRFVYGATYVPYADLLIVVAVTPMIAGRLNILGLALRALEHTRPLFLASAGSAGVSVAVGLQSLACGGVACGGVAARLSG